MIYDPDQVFLENGKVRYRGVELLMEPTDLPEMIGRENSCCAPLTAMRICRESFSDSVSRLQHLFIRDTYAMSALNYAGFWRALGDNVERPENNFFTRMGFDTPAKLISRSSKRGYAVVEGHVFYFEPGRAFNVAPKHLDACANPSDLELKFYHAVYCTGD